MKTKVIRGGWVLTMAEGKAPIKDGMVKIVGEKIAAVAPWKDQQLDPDWELVDASDSIIMPGLVNTHTHAAMVLFRNFADDLPLMAWLQEKIWPLEENLTAEDVYWGTRLAINEMLLSGTTTFADMYFFQDEVAQATEESGIRAVLSRGLIGVNPQAEKNLAEAVEQAKKWRGKGEGRIQMMLAPHAPYTCPPDFLKEVVAAARHYQLGIHIHLSETRDELEQIGRSYGKRPVAYLAEQGIFSRPVLAAHGVWLDDAEISYLSRQKVGVAHNPSSNMKLASGIAPVVKMLTAKIPVGLGTDGAASNNRLDMFTEMRTAALLHKLATEEPTALTAETALRMATIEGARALGLEEQIGSLEQGKKADLIRISLHKSHLTPCHNPVALLVYTVRGGDVTGVMVNGEWLVEDGKILKGDEEEVCRETGKRAEALREMSIKPR